jgi:hypothetical protein
MAMTTRTKKMKMKMKMKMTTMTKVAKTDLILFCAVLVRRKTALVLTTPTITTKMTRATVQMYRSSTKGRRCC